MIPRQKCLDVAVEADGGEVGPAEDERDAGDVDDGLAGDPLGHLADVGALGGLGGGQALEGVGLKGAHGVADGAHDGEVAAAGGADGGTSDDGRHFFVWGWLFVWLSEVLCSKSLTRLCV